MNSQSILKLPIFPSYEMIFFKLASSYNIDFLEKENRIMVSIQPDNTPWIPFKKDDCNESIHSVADDFSSIGFWINDSMGSFDVESVKNATLKFSIFGETKLSLNVFILDNLFRPSNKIQIEVDIQPKNLEIELSKFKINSEPVRYVKIVSFLCSAFPLSEEFNQRYLRNRSTFMQKWQKGVQSELPNELILQS